MFFGTYKIILLIFFILLLAVTSRITQINREIEQLNASRQDLVTLEYFQTYFDHYFDDKVIQWENQLDQE